MSTPAAALSAQYRVYEEKLRQLHLLIAAGRAASEEARELRLEMEAPGMELTQEEVDRANGISADLYMLSGQEIFQPHPGDRPTPDVLFQQLRRAWEGGDWSGMLDVLRRGPVNLGPAQVGYLRARAYDELGHTATAALFIRHALDLMPSDETYAFLALELLQRAGDLLAAVGLAETYLADPQAPLAPRIQAAAVLFSATRGASDANARALFQRLTADIPPLTENIEFYNLPPAAQALAFVTLGFSQEALSQEQRAHESFSRAVELDPDNSEARVARGLLALQHNPAAAVTDFVRAVDKGTFIVAPYLYLAQEALKDGRYSDCRVMCDRALRLQTATREEAELRELRAIALLSLRTQVEEARLEFQAAVSIDPLNEGIRSNFYHFGQMEQAQPAVEWRQVRWPYRAEFDVTGARAALRESAAVAA